MYQFQIYKDKKKQYRWKLKAKNGRVIADSAEGYVRKASLMDTLQNLISFTGVLFSVEDTTDGSTIIRG